jgi:ABC-type oligopeptide transport system ATPase subunit
VSPSIFSKARLWLVANPASAKPRSDARLPVLQANGRQIKISAQILPSHQHQLRPFRRKMQSFSRILCVAQSAHDRRRHRHEPPTSTRSQLVRNGRKKSMTAGDRRPDQETCQPFPHEFSGGQRQASASPPWPWSRVIIFDNDLSARRFDPCPSHHLLEDLQKDKGPDILFIAHDLSMSSISRTASGSCISVIWSSWPKAYALRRAAPPLHPGASLRIPVPEPTNSRAKNQPRWRRSDQIDPPAGCPFYDTIPKAMPVCKEKRPR